MKILTRRLFTILLPLMILSNSIASEGIVVEGSIDCGDWIEARRDNNAGYFEHYLIGQLNGMAMGTRLQLWRNPQKVSRQQVFLWMDKHCRENPLGGVLQGAVRYADEITKGAWSQRFKTP